jgi:hypothetical protein
MGAPHFAILTAVVLLGAKRARLRMKRLAIHTCGAFIQSLLSRAYRPFKGPSLKGS